MQLPMFATLAIERLRFDESLRTPAKVDELLDAYAAMYGMDASLVREDVHAHCARQYGWAAEGNGFAAKFALGRKIADALPPLASTLRPSAAELAHAAKACGVSQKQARGALDTYNYGGVS